MKRWSIAVLLLCAGFALSAAADELAERAAIGQEAAQFFFNERFAQLDARAEEFRTSRSRTPSGLWKLTNLYAGIDRALRRRSDDPIWPQLDTMAQSWLAASPQSPTAHLVRAKIHIARAWSYRGGGYANTVDPKNWPPFYEHVGRARQSLEASKSIAAVDPHWYELMGLVATYQNWNPDAFDALIDEGLRREPLFYQTYFTAMAYYSPKWGGSAREIEEFANAAVKRTRSSEGTGMYARIYWYASQQSYGERLFTDSSVVWSKMKLGIDDVLARYPDSWNLNNFAKFACLAGDREKARALIAKVGDAPLLVAWRGAEEFQRCRTWAMSA